MSTTLFRNIGQLINVREQEELLRGKALAHLPVIKDAWLLVEGGKIADYGLMSAIPQNLSTPKERG